MKPLAGQVAVVAGATRGGGRGIARMLGEAGATVYCTGRSSRAQPNTSDHHYAGRPETIEETAELVTAAGGRGVAVRVDHTVADEVAGLFKRVKREEKRLDILVNILTGSPVKDWQPFWKLDVDAGREMVNGWVWPHVVTCRHAVPLMLERKSGLVVEVVEQDTIGYHGQFFFDLFELTLKRLAHNLAEELAPHGVSAVAVTPGFMRTEAIMEQFGATEENWREVAETNKQARGYGFAGSETPCFVGRAVAALAADPELARKSGGVYSSWGLSEEYGFTDIDGARPHLGNYFAEHFPQLWNRRPRACFEWKLAPVAQEEKTERRRTAKAKRRKSESDAPRTGGKKREHAGSAR
ncbi:MAG TPA: SDR family NAD(P)-dependent oxidoreductase [Pyrinomonadaceae bacterium]|nr:SDR family NAD(P)-dependent oxidoreductase [Pyrinomonadaceae bacterium]